MTPSADAQLQFLQHLQRLFQEGDFVATYKYALMMALAERAVEADDLELAQGITLISLAEKFAELYWPQTVPYVSEIPGALPDLLAQNQGKQAAVVNTLVTLRQTGATTIRQAMLLPGWQASLRKIARIIGEMPVKYLQNLGGVQVSFLYDYPLVAGTIQLKPGVGYMLRVFHPLIQQLARAGWVRHVRENRRNDPVIGKVDALEQFMFGTSRQALATAANVLDKLQSGQCFYCQEHITRAGEVDHFIPWSRYPRDLAHNFVLAHADCNRRKSDMLAAERHLHRWRERNLRHGPEIQGEMTGFLADTTCADQVAKWAYEQAVANAAHGWIEKRQTELLSRSCLKAWSA